MKVMKHDSMGVTVAVCTVSHSELALLLGEPLSIAVTSVRLSTVLNERTRGTALPRRLRIALFRELPDPGIACSRQRRSAGKSSPGDDDLKLVTEERAQDLLFRDQRKQ